MSKLEDMAMKVVAERLQKEGVKGVSIEEAAAALETLSDGRLGEEDLQQSTQKLAHDESKTLPGYGHVHCKECGRLLLSLIPDGFDTIGPLWTTVHRGNHVLVSCPDCHTYTRHELKKYEQELVVQLRKDVSELYLLPDIPATVLFLVSEVGEVCDLVVRLRDPNFLRGTSSGTEEQLLEKLELELGDVFLMLATLATQYDIDLRTALCKAVNKVYRRYEEAKDASSKIETR